MATIDNFTLYSQYAAYRGSLYGFRATGNTPQIGNINGSTSQYAINTNWYGQASLYTFYTYNTTLYLDLSGFTSNTGWQDIRVDSNVFTRASASYNSASDRWTWSGVNVPFGNGTSHDIVVTDDGQVGSGSGINIPLGITSGGISMSTLRDFFGNPTYLSNTISMSDLYRGGNLVPDISLNSSVPTSGAISLSNLHSAYTNLSIDKEPSNKNYFAGFGGAGTATIAWNMASGATAESDVDTGYKALKHGCEFRWVINQTSSSGNAPYLSAVTWDGTTYTSGLSFPYTTPWSSGISGLLMDFPYGVTTGSISGTAYLEVRKVWNNTTYTLTSTSAYWSVVVETAGE